MRPITLLFLIFFACGDPPSEESSTDISTTSEKQEKSTSSGECCMKSLDDFKPFLPQSVGSFSSKGNLAGNMFCLDDPGMHSQASRSYYDSDDIKYRVMIRDYCAKNLSEFEHMADEDNNPNLKSSDGALKIIKSDLIQGYAKYYKENPNLNSGNPAKVSAIIDGRFYLSINAQDQKGIDQVMALYNALPTANLASVGK